MAASIRKRSLDKLNFKWPSAIRIDARSRSSGEVKLPSHVRYQTTLNISLIEKYRILHKRNAFYQCFVMLMIATNGAKTESFGPKLAGFIGLSDTCLFATQKLIFTLRKVLKN